MRYFGSYMKIAVIKWNDALSVEADHHPPVAELALQTEVGFLLHETDEAVLIGMEIDTGPAIPGRWRLNIPKKMIVSMKVLDVEGIFEGKRRKRVKTVISNERTVDDSGSNAVKEQHS
jgi:hypothetical protein